MISDTLESKCRRQISASSSFSGIKYPWTPFELEAIGRPFSRRERIVALTLRRSIPSQEESSRLVTAFSMPLAFLRQFQTLSSVGERMFRSTTHPSGACSLACDKNAFILFAIVFHFLTTCSGLFSVSACNTRKVTSPNTDEIMSAASSIRFCWSATIFSNRSISSATANMPEMWIPPLCLALVKLAHLQDRRRPQQAEPTYP